MVIEDVHADEEVEARSATEVCASGGDGQGQKVFIFAIDVSPIGEVNTCGDGEVLIDGLNGP